MLLLRFELKLKEDDSLSNHIKKNMQMFREAVTRLLHEKAQITVLRISHVEVIVEESVVHVLFTLNEKASFYGDVEAPKFDEINSRNSFCSF